MPEQDIYSGIQPKSAGQSDADYDAYLTSIAQERLPIVNPVSINLFKTNYNKLSTQKPVAPLKTEWTEPAKIPAKATGISGTTSAPIDKAAANVNQGTEQSGLSPYEQQMRVADQQDAAKSELKTETFLNQAALQSPNLKKQAQYEANKYGVQQRQANDLGSKITAIKSANPHLDPTQVYAEAIEQQAQQDLHIGNQIKKIGRNTFDQIISKQAIKDILPKDDDFDKDYFSSDKFKRDVYKASDGNPRLFKQMASEIAERKSLEYKNAPTKIAQMQQGLLDNAHLSPDPISRALYYGLAGSVAGAQSLVKLGASGASAIEAATGMGLTPEEKKGSFLSKFARLNQEKRQSIAKYSPEAKAINESGAIDETMGSAARMIGELGAAGYAKIPGLGKLGQSELFTNKLLAKYVDKMPVNKIAQFMDNYAGMAKSIGPLVYGDYYEKLKAKGYSDDDAANKALTRTGVNLAAFSALSPFQGAMRNSKLAQKLSGSLSGRTAKVVNGIVNYGLDAAKVTGEGVAAMTADAYQDFNDAKQRGGIPTDQVFDPTEAIKSGLAVAPTNAIAILGNRFIGGHGKLPSEPEAGALAETLNNPMAFEDAINKNVRKGIMDEGEASRALGMVEAVKPFYEEGLSLRTNKGKPYTPVMAAQHAVERARLEESVKSLQENDKLREDIQNFASQGLNTEQSERVNGQLQRIDERGAALKEQTERSARALDKLAGGTYTQGQLLSSSDVSEKHSISEDKLPEVADNGPYESETVHVADVANDPAVQQRISELQNNPEAQPNVEEPVVVSPEGKVISGHDQVADAAINGDITIDAFTPASKDKMDNIIREDVTSDAVNTEGLDNDQTKILHEIRGVFDKAKPKLGEGAAFSDAAYDVVERGFDREQGIDQLMRIANNEVKRPVAEFYYNEALKKYKSTLPEEIADVTPETEETVQPAGESTLSIEDQAAQTPEIPPTEQIPTKSVDFNVDGVSKSGDIIEESPLAYKVKDENGDTHIVPKEIPETEKDNYDKVIDFLEGLKQKKGTVYSSVLPVTPELLNKALDIMIGTVKATRSVAKGIDAMVEYFRANGSTVTRKEVEDYISSPDPNKRNTLMQQGINKEMGLSTSKSDKADISNLKTQIRLEAKAAKQGYSAGKKEGRIEGEITQGKRMAKEMRELEDGYKRKIEAEADKSKKALLERESKIKQKELEQQQLRERYKSFSDQVNKHLRDAVKNGSITTKQAGALANRAANIGASEYNLNRFMDYADKVFADADYNDKLSTANSLQSKIKKATKSGTTFADHLSILGDLKRIPLDNLSTESLARFTDIAQQYANSKLPVSNENYAPFDLKAAQDQLASIQDELDAQIRDRAQELTGLDNLTTDEAKLITDAMDAEEPDAYVDNLAEAKRKAVTDALRKQANYSQMGLQERLSDPNFTDNINEKGVKMLREISKTDLSDIQAKSLIPLIKTLDNSITNGSIANVGKVYDAVRSVTDSKTLKDLNTKDKLFQLNKLQEATESLPLLLKSIFGHTTLAGNFRRLTGFDDVFNGGSKNEKNQVTSHREWEKFKRENKIGNTAEERFQRGMYALLIQNEGGSQTEINDQYNINKLKIQQSIEALKTRESTKQQAETLADIYDRDFLELNTPEDLQKIFSEKYPKQVKAVKFFQDKFSDLKNDLKFITEAYQNEKFDEVNNYTPLSYRFIDNSIGETPDAGMYFIDRYSGRPKQTPTTISRSGSNNIPAGSAIDFDFDFNMFNKLKRAGYDINTISGRSKFSEMSKQSNFTESVGGGDNKERVIRQYNKAERTQAGDKGENDASGELLQHILSPSRKLAGAFALGGFTQLPKQYLSVGVKSLFTLGKDAPILLDIMANAKNKKIPLLDLASVASRGSRQGGVNIGDGLPLENRTADGIKNILRKYGQIVDKTTELALKPLEFGDTSVARQSWLAYYMQFLKNNGNPIKVSDLSTEHERLDPVKEQAMSYANQMVDETQVVSNAALQADLSRNQGNQWKDVLRNIFIPFNTFSANHRARMVEDWKFIFKGNASQRAEAIRDVAGNAFEIAAFNSLKGFALKAILYQPGKEFLNWLFDLNIQTDDEAEEVKRNMKKATTDVIKDLTVSGIGSLGENGTIDAINKVNYWVKKVTEPTYNKTYNEYIKDDKLLYTYDHASTTPKLDYMGSYGILPKEILQDYRDSKGALSGNYLNEYAYDKITAKPKSEVVATFDKKEDIELNKNQRRYMQMLAAADALGLIGLRDADIMKILQSTKVAMLRKPKVEQKPPQW